MPRSRSANKKRKTSKKSNTNKGLFKKEDYESSDGMLTSIWGPSLWHTLHTISFNYPIKPTNKQKKQYYDFFIALQNVLPCGACRNNLKNNLKKCPLTNKSLKNRDSLSRWVYKLHNIVNKMLKKKCNLSYSQVRNRYETFRARCSLSDTQEELNKNIHNHDNISEEGCSLPIKGVKSKCVLKIVPKDYNCETLSIDSKCILKK